MPNESTTIVQRLWNYCHVLRDDGVSYGDYVEQLTYLLFLKMADEQTKPPFGKPSIIPKNLDWSSLLKKDGDALEVHYRHILESLGKAKGMLGVFFRKSQNKIQDPAKLKRLLELINDETWVGMDIDVKGEIYEGLLQKNAEDIKSGAGQYFTPRPLIKAMVDVVQPGPGMTICDPACGTGGFLGDDFQQTTELFAARQNAAGDERQSGDRGARQCSLRRRRGRNGTPKAVGRVRCSHAAAATDGCVLCAGREGQRALF